MTPQAEHQSFFVKTRLLIGCLQPIRSYNDKRPRFNRLATGNDNKKPQFSRGKALGSLGHSQAFSPFGPNDNLILFMPATTYITQRHMDRNSGITATYKLLINNSLQVRATKQIKKKIDITLLIYLFIYYFSVR